MRHLAALLPAWLAGCVAAVPPAVDPGALPPCAPGSYGPLSTTRCHDDADCGACDEGAGCRIARTDECPLASPCEARCCLGRCVVPSEPAPLGEP